MTTGQQQMLTTALLVSATLTAGAVVAFGAVTFAGFFGIMSLISFYLLSRSEQGEDFFKSSKFEQTTKDGEVHLFGTVVTSGNAEDRLEDRFLNHFALKNIAKRKVYSWIFLATGTYFLFKFHGAQLTTTVLVSIASFLFVVNAYSVGQLLTSLLVNAAVVAASYSETTSLAALAVYVALVFITMAWIAVVKNVGFSSRAKDFFHRSTLLRIAGVGVLFFVLLLALSFLLPPTKKRDERRAETSAQQLRRNDFFRESRQSLLDMATAAKELPSSTKTAQLQQEIAETLASAELGAPTPADVERLELETSDLRQQYDDLLTAEATKRARANELSVPELASVVDGISEQEFAQLSDMADRIEGSTALTPSEREKLRHFRETFENVPRAQVDRSAVERASNELPPVGGARNPVLDESKAGLTREEQQKLLSYVHRKQDQPTTPVEQKALEAMEKMLAGEALDKLDRGKLQEELDTLRKEAQAEATTNSSAARPATAPKADELFEKTDAAAAKAKRGPDEEPLDPKAFMSYWRLLLLVLVILYLRWKLKKKGIETIEVPEPKELPELRRRWRELSRKKLSPREEVIHYYNLFHESMQKFHYAYEAPPSCALREDLREFAPALEKSSFVVTELFCLCFYGERNVSDKNLKVFRKAIRNFQKIYKLG